MKETELSRNVCDRHQWKSMCDKTVIFCPDCLREQHLFKCPFCGSFDILCAPKTGYPVAVKCLGCGIDGPAKPTAEEAETAWNTRS